MFISRHCDVSGMKSDKKGKNNKKSTWVQSWGKAFLVMAGILFVGVMIITSMGTSWLVAMNPARGGDIAYVDVTLKDELGRTVFTTNQRNYNATLEKGTAAWVWFASPMVIPVNVTTTEMVKPVPAYLRVTGQDSFAFLGPEYNQIASGLVGMKEGETRRITFVPEPSFQREMTEQEFTQIGGNFTTTEEGDFSIFGFTTGPMINTSNTTPQYALRTVTLKDKTDNNITVNYGYSGADITILRLTRSS
jgi:hypothetical protein